MALRPGDGITDPMQQRTQTLSWPALLAALRKSAGETVEIHDGKLSAPAGTIGNRQAAKGTELCLFAGDVPTTRAALIAKLEDLEKRAGRRFVTSARVRIGDAHLLIAHVGDDDVDGTTVTVIRPHHPKLGYNQSMQTGDSTTLRSKRIKNG